MMLAAVRQGGRRRERPERRDAEEMKTERKSVRDAGEEGKEER